MATPYDYTVDTVNGPLNGAAHATYTPPPGGATTAARRSAKPTLEYLTGGRGYGMPADPRTLPTTLDDAVRAMGPRLYAAMNTDPVVRSAKDVLRYGALAGGMDLAPAVKPKAGAKVLTPEEQAAKDAVDECWRSVERLGDWESVLLDLLEATWAGVRLAEPVFELADSGPDAGKMALASLRVKPNDAWAFVVDPFLAVVGIEARPSGGEPAVVYPAEKFLWLTNEPRDGDPRGTSDYRPAVEPWCNKVKFWPELYRHLQQFGSASLIGKLGPNHSRSPGVDAFGDPVAGEDVTPEKRMGQSLQWFRNGFYMVINHDDDVIPIPPQGDGAAFHSGFALANREITQAILGTPSATLEAEHDSRAKGQTGQDIVSLKIESKRKALAAAIRRLLRMLMALNHGPEAADRLTPLVTFGQSEPQDRPALWGAAGGLKSSGYLGESQIAELDQMIGLPIRDAEADEAKAKQKADEAMKQQQMMKPPPGEGGGDGPPSTSGEGGPKPTPPRVARGEG